MRRSFRHANRSLLLAVGSASIAQAGMTIDLRVTSTTSGVIIDSKNVYFTSQPGGLVAFDCYALITGNNANPDDEGLASFTGSFLSGTGDLRGNLSAIRDPRGTGTGSTNGKIQDLDGDGDLDVGSNNDASSANFFSGRFIMGAPTPVFGSEIHAATVTWMFTGENDRTTVNFRPRNSSSAGSWFEDGSQITSPNFFAGVPVTIYTPEPTGASGAFVAAGLLARRRGSS